MQNRAALNRNIGWSERFQTRTQASSQAGLLILAIVGFLHLSLRVSDLDRSRRFYCDALGCEVGEERTFEGPAANAPAAGAVGPVRSVVVTRDGFRIELFELDAARPADAAASAEAGPVHLVFTVDDLESTLHSLRDRGVAVMEETRTRFARGVGSCFVRDPDGLPIQLYQRVG
jgi:glyoxylase I family protein